MTAMERRAAAAIIAWCEKHKRKVIGRPRHLHPRAYVVGYSGYGCLIVAFPWIDSEPQCQQNDKANGLVSVHYFDQSLKAGDWCTCAYVCWNGIQETVAIPVVA